VTVVAGLTGGLVYLAWSRLIRAPEPERLWRTVRSAARRGAAG
jgi:hypothetical protein